MPEFTLVVNDETLNVEVAADTPLMWVLRDALGLTGTKYGCGMSLCGACIVHLNGNPVPSCEILVSEAVDQRITTIEGLSSDGSHPVQLAWVELNTPQCGYCQSGQIMQAAALLERNDNPTDDQIDAALSDVLCRCGAYDRMRKAVRRAVEINHSVRGTQ
jgi:isoquinoline 1-oxidoreductase subunit alpha